MRPGPTYSENEARRAIAASPSFAEALRRLGRCQSGGAGWTLRKWTVIWRISTDHFDPYAAARGRRKPTRLPLEEILVESSTYSRGKLKQRLFEAA